jgi:hypothetical protein
VSHFNHEYTAGFQMLRGLRDDAAHEVEPVASAGERERRFFSIFGRQLVHRSVGDVRRVRENHVVATAFELPIQIRFHECDAIA